MVLHGFQLRGFLLRCEISGRNNDDGVEIFVMVKRECNKKNSHIKRHFLSLNICFHLLDSCTLKAVSNVQK